MKLFQNERTLRVLRPLATALGLIAGLWHGVHTLSAWTRMQELKTSDPTGSNVFWQTFQTELSLTLAALFAGVMAWHLFKPRQPSSPP